MGGSHGGLVALGLFLMLVGGGLAFWFSRMNNAFKVQASASAAWPSVAGTVVAAEVQTRRHGGGLSGGRQSAQHTPLIAYHYGVGDQGYQGTRIRYGLLVFNFKGGAEKVLAPYPVGAQVRVHYNPANPADSVLEAGAMTGNLQFGVYAGIGTAILGLLLAVAFR
jgi:hypothetical protein